MWVTNIITIYVYLVSLTSVTVFMQTWNHGPSDVQKHEGDNVTLECQLDGEVAEGLEPRWERRLPGETVPIVIATKRDGCDLDNCEYLIDNTINTYYLVLTDVKLEDQGEYWCSVLNLDPQYLKANLGVWVLPSEVSIDHEETVITLEMPKSCESIIVNRTCVVDDVAPEASLTWTYNISSDVRSTIEGELDYDFESGTVDDISPSVNYNVEVVRQSKETNGRYKSKSTLIVTFTAAGDGKLEENLRIDVKCKSKQVALVGPDGERQSKPIQVSVVESVDSDSGAGNNAIVVILGVLFAISLAGNVVGIILYKRLQNRPFKHAPVQL
ncbi:uncharacterized protein LOC100376469 [Saccoglossus kowalevskii]|uniref:Uncharacterized protein LOC100376469 n=1 Tax=Saccoglossus kowalevskii TaxID=10224 RepID=A0ABM0GPP2_SACKO|nr:PREDICTED: uncharacterized protein LOC100376469 [Saccoglossus kowalevskii]